MPIKKGTCGIYAIKTPTGSTYVGSSICIERRFNEHKSMLRRGEHHSSRLQKAYTKHKDKLVFSILCTCTESDLVELEQKYINSHKAKLNVAQDVNNVWTNPNVRAKLEAVYGSAEYRAKRRIIANRPAKNWKKVECSDGAVYQNMTEAGRAYGISATRVKEMISSGYPGRKTTVKFKFKGDDWPPNLPYGERLKQARKNNGNDKMSAEAKQKMSLAKKGKKPSPQALAASIKSASIPVIGISLTSGDQSHFASATIAASQISAGNINTTRSQINKCIRGVKKTAYGFRWEYA
jgi:group I intron endonuclease